MNKKELVVKHKKIVGILTKIINFLNIRNRFRLNKNQFKYRIALFDGLRIYIKGKNNILKIGDFSRLRNCKVFINGNDNVIEIGNFCYFNGTDFYIEDNENKIIIKEHSSFDGKTELATIEGHTISIGKDCMFSRNINVRTGDAHTIVNENNERINESKDVWIGDHCWIGMNVTLLKGCHIGNNCVVGASSITSGFFSDGCVIAGDPARVIKTKVNWKRERS